MTILLMKHIFFFSKTLRFESSLLALFNCTTGRWCSWYGPVFRPQVWNIYFFYTVSALLFCLFAVFLFLFSPDGLTYCKLQEIYALVFFFVFLLLRFINFAWCFVVFCSWAFGVFFSSSAPFFINEHFVETKRC